MSFPTSGTDQNIPFGLPPGISKSLGDIVIGWARIEAILAEFLSFLLKADHGAMYVLNQDIAGGTQLKWIRVLANDRYREPENQKFLPALFDRIDAIRGERNAYVHAVWAPGPEPGTARAQTVKLDRTEIVREQLVTAADLDDLFSDIQAVGEELFNLAKGLGVIK